MSDHTADLLALQHWRARAAELEHERDAARAEIGRLRAELARLCDRGTLQALRDANDRAEQAEREGDEAVALLREIGDECNCPLCDLGHGVHDVCCRLAALLEGRDA